jgi:hypothetical protein
MYKNIAHFPRRSTQNALFFHRSSISAKSEPFHAALAERKGAERQNLISIKSNVRAERAAHGSCSFLQLALFIFPRFPSLS